MYLTIEDACTKLGIDYFWFNHEIRGFLKEGKLNGKKVGKRGYWIVETDDEAFKKIGKQLIAKHHRDMSKLSEESQDTDKRHIKEKQEDLKRRVKEGYKYTWNVGSSTYTYDGEIPDDEPDKPKQPTQEQINQIRPSMITDALMLSPIGRDKRKALVERAIAILSNRPIQLTNTERYILVSEIAKQLLALEGEK